MAYNVIFSTSAEQDLAKILNYCFYNLENAQAVDNILKDLRETEIRLSRIASSLRIRDDLGAANLRSIKLKKHKYLLIYEIINNEVHVLNVYHTSQDIKTRLQNLNSPT